MNIREVVLAAIEALGVPYFITGSDAMTFYGTGRSTADTDVVVQLDPNAYERQLRPLLEEQGAYVADGLRQVDRSVGQASLGPAWVDIIMPDDSTWTRSCFDRRLRLFDGALGGDAWVISPEDLVIAKLLWDPDLAGRQFEDIVRLLRDLELDGEYLERAAGWTGSVERLGVARKKAGRAPE